MLTCCSDIIEFIWFKIFESCHNSPLITREASGIDMVTFDMARVCLAGLFQRYDLPAISAIVPTACLFYRTFTINQLIIKRMTNLDCKHKHSAKYEI